MSLVSETLRADVLRIASGRMPGSRLAPAFVARRRRSDHTTSSAVTGRPSWKRAPSASRRSSRRRSALACHELAARGLTICSPGTVSAS